VNEDTIHLNRDDGMRIPWEDELLKWSVGVMIGVVVTEA